MESSCRHAALSSAASSNIEQRFIHGWGLVHDGRPIDEQLPFILGRQAFRFPWDAEPPLVNALPQFGGAASSASSGLRRSSIYVGQLADDRDLVVRWLIFLPRRMDRPRWQTGCHLLQQCWQRLRPDCGASFMV